MSPPSSSPSSAAVDTRAAAKGACACRSSVTTATCWNCRSSTTLSAACEASVSGVLVPAAISRSGWWATWSGGGGGGGGGGG
eukprot:CAMPEP_0175851646 /NCGR_PEP_ID=MMETSP0107_2-20121207/25775_1 /TAXON_ID=195067 ORGANISM="Goniomonas pacifica, Strain CCMP1869" /NCGR_SAMPLE_ID=MMETSP0107_2 /ASSEMBLY_ACC=CAM_ASM_000203 /LENGTH=81 /DNA_ID=CAMNT_0017167097 /DNA_START=141 /DNA_END=383 /DNA_ORIENTATION=-